MDEQTFWQLIERSRARMTPTLSDQAEILQEELKSLPPDHIIEFERIFVGLHRAAYRWDLWAAAYIIEGGCSDDGFDYFRAGLIGLGQAAYYDACRDPATLAHQPSCGVDFSNEELLYVARKAYEAVTGDEMRFKYPPYPTNPAGTEWDPDTVDELFPTLAQKFSS